MWCSMESYELKEILKALELHSEKINTKINDVKEELETKMQEGFGRVERRLDHLDKKFDGLRVEVK